MLLIELIQQGDKYTKNALREALIRAEVCGSKKEARNYIEELSLDQKILESWASRLSLADLRVLEKKISS